jgi:hypothetical protein
LLPPHEPHAPFMHVCPVTLHTLPAQHGWPVPPQVAHFPAAQVVVAAVH